MTDERLAELRRYLGNRAEDELAIVPPRMLNELLAEIEECRREREDYNGLVSSVLRRAHQNEDEIERLKSELAEATNCPDCNGRGKRWYSLYGEATCERCKGSGDR